MFSPYPQEFTADLSPTLVLNFSQTEHEVIKEVSNYFNRNTQFWDFKSYFTLLKIEDLKQFSTSKARLNISPLHFESPLYPDGLMSAKWITKHCTLPSLFCLFHCLWNCKDRDPLFDLLVTTAEKEMDKLQATKVNETK